MIEEDIEDDYDKEHVVTVATLNLPDRDNNNLIITLDNAFDIADDLKKSKYYVCIGEPKNHVIELESVIGQSVSGFIYRDECIKIRFRYLQTPNGQLFKAFDPSRLNFYLHFSPLTKVKSTMAGNFKLVAPPSITCIVVEPSRK